MKFQIFTAALYASLALASAIPQPPVGGVSALQARGVDIDNKPEEDWVCPGKDGKTVTYKKNEINAAITKGVELAKDGKQVSNGNDNPFPCIPDKYKDAKHFPMKNGKGAFNGQRPAKPERVMYLHSGDSDDAEFIGLWTHEGAAKGQFLQCREKDD
ncbi:hypothetical protein SNOG_00182 [Parastagonospora nodorum SN15]|uniref:Uncharacterized protein n=1 Tax=Phaeosphaeria nodorum (strain SN15 / ATCC MYA-4574 / FGSC 10173) TaxID=321614 RepID=Q0V732_PHANO|nr:hypothetical protein SNOG_00182 [Parastagonospora nodorum SN15]EAT91677.2 hypothetical protein SNOG_00182 [Parastagonospora nodorum SN15]